MFVKKDGTHIDLFYLKRVKYYKYFKISLILISFWLDNSTVIVLARFIKEVSNSIEQNFRSMVPTWAHEISSKNVNWKSDFQNTSRSYTIATHGP